MASRQPLQDLPELLPPARLALLAGQHQVGIEVVRHQGGRQQPEVKLEHRTVGQQVDTISQETQNKITSEL